eukprot:2791914-Prorocentrum_lima.AAC.1
MEGAHLSHHHWIMRRRYFVASALEQGHKRDLSVKLCEVCGAAGSLAIVEVLLLDDAVWSVG